MRFELAAWVIMPEHVHLLLMPALPDHPINRVLEGLKGRFAKSILGHWRRLEAPILPRITDERGRQHFWQQGGGYDRNIYSSEEAQEKLVYIHNNPVTRGLSDSPDQWRWSSARWYEHGVDDWSLKMTPDLV